MDRLIKWYLRFQQYQRGQTLAEYGLIAAGVAGVCIAAYQLFGTNVNTMVSKVAGDI
jgi:Flp pilus assembly pilin Flp